MDEIVNFLTAVHSSLQTQQQVRQPGLPGSRQVGVQVAALLPQVHLTGFSQRVTDSVVLRDQLLTGGQSITALWRGRRGGRGVSETQTSSLWSQDTTELVDLCPPSPPPGGWACESYLFWHGLFKLVIEQTLVDFPFTCLNLWRGGKKEIITSTWGFMSLVPLFVWLLVIRTNLWTYFYGIWWKVSPLAKDPGVFERTLTALWSILMQILNIFFY